MKTQHSRTLRMLALLATSLVVFVTGCGSGSALNPAFQPQVGNNPDNFQFQSTGVQNVSQVLQYTWSNSGTHASVNQATTVSAGVANLQIRDSQGTLVYNSDLALNGTFPTNPVGQAGNWTIVLTLTNYSGTLNFRAQMAP